MRRNLWNEFKSRLENGNVIECTRSAPWAHSEEIVLFSNSRFASTVEFAHEKCE